MSANNLSKYIKYKVAVVQATPVLFDSKACIEKVKTYATEASTNGAKLALFPECFISGYPRATTFGAGIGVRPDSGRDYFANYFRSAIQVPGPATKELEQVASNLNIFIAVGCTERDGSTLYCTILFIDPHRGLIGKRRKLMPTAAEAMVWGRGDQSTIDVFDTNLGNIGGVICWENYMPLVRTHMYEQNIQVYLAPTMDDKDTFASTMQHIAKEGRCYALSSCMFVQRKHLPKDYPTLLSEDPETTYVNGGSCIVDPLGNILAGPIYNQEGVLYADLDLSKLPGFKWEFDSVGHYSRTDIFQLVVNKNKLFTRKSANKSGRIRKSKL
ncbi:nitrilase [Conidiobolus coronatus NRRL 28638]|uniref:Nitrilase n=1 Tax=Conidiobolus coronatus (strain ATCC 28846 / CBS 209.66 / NRRL 28638) TaxID=796925 RepID=A0A137NWF7_CONC2|nr:nitrilase [Conidiobolus coronatus NRRL 28638]|eukprot:KXN67143.1 nitrilase [Conidiobolus coronatus NRRL 28638]